ncbi:Pumilio domain-containing protein 7 [Caenorhabditis elegans]|uniref:Pumilio domain-containing protein 7 n=1 Tax=Caenorhabditis elegans TaxID=6239 RepID=PUF7_CAEEL|nr:Pumilio domain-containing protein 7 [Caenorhabditis elegans]O44169.1 RecName: Full=Pumilio domain-containing protein 7 [Caenorhabditis elegans]CCD61586.1 Pumilio domain-containing protein 7 [Caenorhabditis elegans]|eukprot:NP_500820.1 Pumilio domain-containing protein 7 [Caenorhabditis elegans]
MTPNRRSTDSYNMLGASFDFDPDFSLLSNKTHKNKNPKPPVKLLPYRHGSNTTSSDSDSYIFNSGSGSSDAETPAPVAPIFISLEDVLLNGQLIDFAIDPSGVKFLEANYPLDSEDQIRKAVFEKFTESTTLFVGLCHSRNGNFIVQKLVELATPAEQRELLRQMIDGGLLAMCKDKFACRVVQLALQKFDHSNVFQLIQELSTFDLAAMCTDQISIHVIQRVVKQLPVDMWTFFVHFLSSGDSLMAVCQDKYGCRLVQQVIDRLAENPKLPCFKFRIQLLHSLMTCIVRNCYRLSSNEFANYVIQYVIKSSGIMEMYRDTIIDKCLLRNLLSMSQDKYASHVIEGAFLFAPPALLHEMMEEIFSGYVKDVESNRDALDILLFHQYGNYVVQQMISICTAALIGKEERELPPAILLLYSGWYEKMKQRVLQHASRLERFSSGKKIIDSVMRHGVPTAAAVNAQAAPSLMELTAQFDAMFPSFLAR